MRVDGETANPSPKYLEFISLRLIVYLSPGPGVSYLTTLSAPTEAPNATILVVTSDIIVGYKGREFKQVLDISINEWRRVVCATVRAQGYAQLLGRHYFN